MKNNDSPVLKMLLIIRDKILEASDNFSTTTSTLLNSWLGGKGTSDTYEWFHLKERKSLIWHKFVCKNYIPQNFSFKCGELLNEDSQPTIVFHFLISTLFVHFITPALNQTPKFSMIVNSHGRFGRILKIGRSSEEDSRLLLMSSRTKK